MSRIGKQPIVLPKGTKIDITDTIILVEGPKGKLSLSIPYGIKLKLDSDTLLVTRMREDKLTMSLHGTIRALISNMVKGVNEEFKKELTIVGVGYKAQIKGNKLMLNLGFSHPVEMGIPSDIKISVPAATRIVIEGIDKQKVSQFSAQIRKFYPPEPYKGKGIRYSGEEVRKKLGKALAK